MDPSSKDEGPSSYVNAQRVPEPARPGPPPPPPQKIVIEQPGGMFGRYGKFLWIALVVSIVANVGQRVAYQDYFAPSEKINERFLSGSKRASDKIAVIRVEGAILDGEGFVKRQIDTVRDDESVKAVVLRIDSPGGTVTASDYLYHYVTEMTADREIPLVVSMGSLCASGGYYVAMAVGDQDDAILAEPTSWTGSIGVIIPHFDVSELLARWDIKDDSIASGPLKQLGSPTQMLSPEQRAREREILQTLVNETFERFKEIVRAGRPALRDNADQLAAVSTGQIFTADQALENGLVDRIGFLDDAVGRAAELAGLDQDDVRVVKYTRHVPGIMEALTGTEARVGSWGRFDVKRLMELTAPRAYYLSTWLPAVLSAPELNVLP